MYNDPGTDPVVKYYDETVGVSGKSEIEWYKENAMKFGGPVLDIACGTGRMSLVFAKMGYVVTSIDNSQGMLSRFKNKLSKNPELASKITLHNLPMTNFSFHQRFNTIVCVDAFFHNLTVDDEKQCLDLIHQHLTPSGRFFFNVHSYNPKFVELCKKSAGKTWTERKRYWIKENTEQIVLKQALDITKDEKMIITKLQFLRYDIDGVLLSDELSEWKTHCRTLEQYKKIINDANLEIEKLVGTYNNGPVTPDSQLIFQIKQQN